MKNYLLSLVLITVLGRTGFAQTTLRVSGTTTLRVSGTTTLKVHGNIVNDNSTIVNDGATIEVTRNVTNTGSFTSTGKEKFSGPGSQTITGVTGTSYFNDAIKLNGGNIDAGSDIRMNTFTFQTDGVLDVSGGYTATINSSSTTAISGYSSTRYVKVSGNQDGKLSRNIGNTSTYVFPLGSDGSGYRRFDFNFSSLGATGSSYVTGSITDNSPGSIFFRKYYPTGFSGSFPGTCTVGTNPQWVEFTCLTDGYWDFTTPTDYTYIVYAHAASCPSGSGPRRTVKMNDILSVWTTSVEPTIVGSIPQNLCANSDWTGTAAAVPGGTYRGSGLFAIAAGYGAPLPVELTMLAAVPVDNQFIRVLWATASEENNAGWVIERSTDGRVFDSIGWQLGNGTTRTPFSYSFDDPNVDQGVVYYYRLRQIDFDGKKENTEIVQARLNPSTKPFFVFPNPIRNIFTITTDNIKTVEIINPLGQTVSSFQAQNVYDVSDLASGVYVVIIVRNNGEILSKRIEKIK